MTREELKAHCIKQMSLTFVAEKVHFILKKGI